MCCVSSGEQICDSKRAGCITSSTVKPGLLMSSSLFTSEMHNANNPRHSCALSAHAIPKEVGAMSSVVIVMKPSMSR